MNWVSWAEFIALGGHGVYVWGAYGVALVCMIAEPLMAHRRRQAALQAALAQATTHNAANC